MYSTRLHVCTRASLTDILARKSARRTKVRGQVGGLNGPRVPQQADFRARRTRRLPSEDTRAEVGEEDRVGVRVRVGPVEFKLHPLLGSWCWSRCM